MDRKALIMKELGEGIELAKQLRIRMLSSNDQAHNYSLVDKMLSSFDKSISLAKLFNFDNGVALPQVDHSNSPNCSSGLSSPTSEASSKNLRASKKRKKMPAWIEMVRVNPNNKQVCGLDGPLNDGLTWRKYGQKDILGAKFPRSYYRCTHRYTQNCVATKQVQKSDEDPSIYQVIYNGEHTCIMGAHSAQAHKKPKSAQIQTGPQPQAQSLSTSQQEGPGPGPKAEIDPIDEENVAQFFRSFSFKSAQFEPGVNDEYMVSCSSPGFRLPETSESDYFPDSTYRITTFGLGVNVQTSGSDVNESFSGPSSVTNSPEVGDFEFNFDMLPDIDSNFSFDFDPPSCCL